MKPKILATGLTGMVGSRIEELLSGHFEFIPLKLPEFDLLKVESLEKAFRRSPQAQTVLHLAAFTDVAAAWQERGDKQGRCYQTNVIGTGNLANLCAKYRKYLIYISTDYVFNGRKKTAYTEADQPGPIEWYGQTKFWAEEAVKKNLTDFSIVRIAFPFRADFEPKLDIIRKIIKGLKEGNLPPMFTDQQTNPTFIDDIAWGLAKFFDRQPRGIFHLVASSFQSPYEMAMQIAGIFGYDCDLVKKGSLVEFEKKLSPQDRPWHKNLGLSNEKVTSELGIKMKTLGEGLKEMEKQLGKN